MVERLFFFDEIQACFARHFFFAFFYERRPELHVLAAGSLLEFALEALPSYGLGRIESLWLYPLSFDEFLLANGESELLKIKTVANPLQPIHEVFHQKLTDYLRQYLLLGGLPEVIQTFIDTNDFAAAFRILDQLILGLDDDFAKYKKRVPVF